MYIDKIKTIVTDAKKIVRDKFETQGRPQVSFFLSSTVSVHNFHLFSFN